MLRWIPARSRIESAAELAPHWPVSNLGHCAGKWPEKPGQHVRFNRGMPKGRKKLLRRVAETLMKSSVESVRLRTVLAVMVE